MKSYNSGCMPTTDFRYEEFEGLLGSFHLSLLPLRDSARPEDQRDYQKAMEVLNGFSQRYGVQSPEDTVKNPRGRGSLAEASVMNNQRMLGRKWTLWRDFNIGADPATEDYEEIMKLNRIILSIFGRYNIAQINYKEYQGEKIPVKLEEWNEDQSRKTLAEILEK